MTLKKVCGQMVMKYRGVLIRKSFFPYKDTPLFRLIFEFFLQNSLILSDNMDHCNSSYLCVVMAKYHFIEWFLSDIVLGLTACNGDYHGRYLALWLNVTFRGNLIAQCSKIDVFRGLLRGADFVFFVDRGLLVSNFRGRTELVLSWFLFCEPGLGCANSYFLKCHCY